jgi:hypothetical protein
MVSEDYPFVGGQVIVSVFEPLGGRGAVVIEGHHPRGYELSVEPISDQIRTRRRQHQPGAADVFTAAGRYRPETDRRAARDGHPHKPFQKTHSS